MINPDALRQLIETVGARWDTVGYGEGVEGRVGLGYSPDAMELSLSAREVRAFENLQTFLSTSVMEEPAFAAVPGMPAPTAPPPAMDWRNVGGQNYVTEPKDQGRCGSCVAFATAGALESAVRLHRNDPGLEIDLSEAHLFFCYAAAQGRNCRTGWFMTAAMRVCQQGVVDEACFPYSDQDQKCDLCQDWNRRLTSITGYTILGTTAEMKAWLASRGPIVTGFTVYEDFQLYAGGIYSHVTGGFLGGHAVLCVGYDDQRRCWICKNSWLGTNWGEGGFFRIAYGQCGIDANMWGINGIAATP